jgi:predicted MFS family arabinose efflux permease
MSLAQIYTLEAVCTVFGLIVDIPTGALSDIVGRKKMLVTAQIIFFISFFGFVFLEQPWHAWVSNLLWMIALALKSGTDKALIQETCIALGKEEGYYRKFIGKNLGYKLFIAALCAPVTSWLASSDLRLPLYCSIPFLIIPLVCTFFFCEPPRQKREFTLRENLNQMGRGIKYVLNDGRIIWITMYTCVISTVSHIWFFTYNPYFEKVGMQIQDFGWVFFVLNLVAFISSYWGERVEKKIGYFGTMLILMPMMGIPLIFMGIFPIPIMAYCVVFQNVVRGMYAPFVDNLTSKFLNDETRATALSVQSSVVSSVGALSMWVFGLIIESHGLMNSLTLLGVVTIFTFIVLISFWFKLFDKNSR